MVVVSFSGFTLASLRFFGFAVRLSNRSIDGAPRGRKPVSEPDPSQDRAGVELLVEPLPTEQAEGNAERDLQAERPEVAERFPVLLHGRSFDEGSRALAQGRSGRGLARCVLWSSLG